MNYFIEFAKRPDGSEIRHRLILSLRKKLEKIPPTKLNSILKLEGIDDIRVAGVYSFDILIAQSFNVEEVIEAIIKMADEIQNEFILDQKIIV